MDEITWRISIARGNGLGLRAGALSHHVIKKNQENPEQVTGKEQSAKDAEKNPEECESIESKGKKVFKEI